MRSGTKVEHPPSPIGDIIKSKNQIIVTLLKQSAMKKSHKTSLSMNQFGQLPAVLINPTSNTGRIIPGIWLGNPQDFTADGTTY